MSKPVALVTGAGGEMGHVLLTRLWNRGCDVVALDLAELEDSQSSMCVEKVRASILETAVLDRLLRKYRPDSVFHLAAILSTKAEAEPDLAHEVNVDGTVGLFRLCRRLAAETGRGVRFLYPSSIAVYGLPDSDAKARAGAVRETEWTSPTSMYGCNKLYGEALGSYFTGRSLSLGEPGLDFRSIRFPGLISAETVPSGGTSDYGPEMIHAAARGEPYSCFVREDTRLPFMTMPDAVDAFLQLADAQPEALSTRVYNIQAFNPTAGEFRDAVVERFPGAKVSFDPVPHRQAIVDSWPGEVDDRRARSDWGFRPRHGLREALDDYLLPALRKRYPSGSREGAGSGTR
jgi:nucleoside-diphosphate-sugar epimerase